MCGLVTIVTPPGREVSAEILEAMTTRLSHRGPDDFGYACIDPHSGQSLNWVSRPPSGMLSGILIGHRRLSILDLTAGGHQPMSNDDGSIVIA